jgi:hypothetical protein
MRNIIDNILNETKDGPATQWNDRIANIAIAAGLPLQNIDWIGSPASVAQRVARYAENYGGPPKEYIRKRFGA